MLAIKPLQLLAQNRRKLTLNGAALAGAIILVSLIVRYFYRLIPEGNDVIHSASISLYFLLGNNGWLFHLVPAALAVMLVVSRRNARQFIACALVLMAIGRTAHFYRIGFYEPGPLEKHLFYERIRQVDERNVKEALFPSDGYLLTTVYRSVMIGTRIPQRFA